MLNNREITCIVCPMGCEMIINYENKDFSIVGNRCIRGEKYAKEEILSPKRILTSTVKITNSVFDRLPVRSDNSIPKNKIFEVMDIINKVSVEAPIAIGAIIIDNVLNLNINIVASRSMYRQIDGI